jgi:excisionase family DNA binding protein
MATDLSSQKAEEVRMTLTVKEAAARTGISRSKLYERMQEGDLASFKSCGRRLIRPEALRSMLAKDEADRSTRKDPLSRRAHGHGPGSTSPRLP